MINSNSNKNTKQETKQETKKNLKKEKEEIKATKANMIRTKQNSKILNNKEKNAKRVIASAKGKSAKEAKDVKEQLKEIKKNIGQENIPSNEVNTKNAHISNPRGNNLVNATGTNKKTPTKRDNSVKQNFTKKISSKKSLKEGEANNSVTEEIVTTTLNTTTNANGSNKNSNKKLKYERQISSGSIKERVNILKQYNIEINKYVNSITISLL